MRRRCTYLLYEYIKRHAQLVFPFVTLLAYINVNNCRLYIHVNGDTQWQWVIHRKQKQESRAIAGRTARCHCKFWY